MAGRAMMTIKVKNCPECTLFSKAWATHCRVCGYEFTDDLAQAIKGKRNGDSARTRNEEARDAGRDQDPTE